MDRIEGMRRMAEVVADEFRKVPNSSKFKLAIALLSMIKLLEGLDREFRKKGYLTLGDWEAIVGKLP
jgi:hypothetical protein